MRDPGLAAVKDRVAALSPADLQAQLVRIGRALSETIHSRYSTEPEHAAHTELDVTSPDFLVDHALWIARELVDRGIDTPHGIGYAGWALMDETGPRRHHLYDGSLGPAVFLAAAAVVSGEDRWRRCARDFAGGASAAVGQGRGRRRRHRRRLRRGVGGLRPDHHRRAARRRRRRSSSPGSRRARSRRTASPGTPPSTSSAAPPAPPSACSPSTRSRTTPTSSIWPPPAATACCRPRSAATGAVVAGARRPGLHRVRPRSGRHRLRPRPPVRRHG